MGCGASSAKNVAVSPTESPHQAVPTQPASATATVKDVVDAPSPPSTHKQAPKMDFPSPVGSFHEASAAPAAASAPSVEHSAVAPSSVQAPESAPKAEEPVSPVQASQTQPAVAPEEALKVPTDTSNKIEEHVAPSPAKQEIVGHGQSSDRKASDEFDDMATSWAKAEETVLKVPVQPEKVAPQRRGWKTVRVFVSSTFADMYAEREVLVKDCFSELRTWCEERKLHLVECDLRWGVPKDSTSENTLMTCLSEVDRCREDNGSPFFLNLLSARYGWIPTKAEVPPKLGEQYQWIDGFSVTAMEIMHAAYRDGNPNAIFFIRDPSFLAELPENVIAQFEDPQPSRKAHLEELKSRLRHRFPERVVDYKCQVAPEWLRDQQGKVKLRGLNHLSVKALEFLKEKIDMQYPLDPLPPDRAEIENLAHEAFLSSRGRVVLGRDDVFDQVRRHMANELIERPLVLIGTPGCGKSAVTAKIAADAVAAMNESKKYGKVLYHFIGACPGSTDLVRLLSRIFRMISSGAVPADAETLIRSIPAMLGEGAWRKQSSSAPKFAIFIDALNQLDTDEDAQGLRWLPTTIHKDMKLVVSTIEGSECHKVLMERNPPPKFVKVGPLATDVCASIVKQYLGEFNKMLDPKQMDMLLAKADSSNPLWLSAACEELRVFGIFEEIDSKISSLPDDLLSLLEVVLERLEKENDLEIIVATCCFVECSRHGLLESELLELLAMYPREELLPNRAEIFSGQKSSGTTRAPSVPGGPVAEETDLHKALHKEKTDAYREEEEIAVTDKKSTGMKKAPEDTGPAPAKTHIQRERLPAALFSQVNRTLGRMMRPCGTAGEGRLDFYHRAVSKAIRRRHLTDENKTVQEGLLAFWHGRLVEYFESVSDQSRKAEELPYHLERILDGNKLASTLVEWPIFERLFTEDNKFELLHSWRTAAGGYGTAAQLYKQSMAILSDNADGVLARKLCLVAEFLHEISYFDDSMELLSRAENLEIHRVGEKSIEVGLLRLTMAKISRKHVFTYQRLCAQSLVPAIKAYDKACEAYDSILSHNSGDKYTLELLECLMMKSQAAGSIADHAWRNIRDRNFPDVDKIFATAKSTLAQAFDLHKKFAMDALLKAELLMCEGQLAYNKDEFSSAASKYLEAATVRKSKLGANHPDVCNSLHRCGRAYEGGRMRKQAAAMYKDALAIMTALFGPEHAQTKMCASDLQDVS